MNHMILIELAIRSISSFVLVYEMKYRNKVQVLLDTRVELLTRGRMNRMRWRRRRFRRIVLREGFLRRSELYCGFCVSLLHKVRKLQNWREHFKVFQTLRQETAGLIEKLKEVIISLEYNEIKVKEALKR